MDQLVFVRPLKTRYEAAQGDVVVGRITEVSGLQDPGIHSPPAAPKAAAPAAVQVAGKRWKVELAAQVGHTADVIIAAPRPFPHLPMIWLACSWRRASSSAL